MDIIHAMEGGRLGNLPTSGIVGLSIIDVAFAFWESTLDFYPEVEKNPLDYMHLYLKTLTFRWLWMIAIFYFLRRVANYLVNPRNLGLHFGGIFACMLAGVLISPIPKMAFITHYMIGYICVTNLFMLICAVGGMLEVLFVIRSPQEVTAMMSFWVIMLITHSLAHFLHYKVFNGNKFASKKFPGTSHPFMQFLFA
ncbi:unnamed protein product [Orchesella dallaii]|uniref:Uncharacterized protein n=1 Tax=Orchesella dallaii TaxID=48710 RepID=A0ABP1R9A2_9HEXA